MPLCNFTANHHIFDVTPIENLFIQEFMLKAPGDFVKVYLYGINQCYHPGGAENSLRGFSHALGLDVKAVENAFMYWERQGIIKFSKSSSDEMNIEYYNIKDVLYNRNFEVDNTLYKYKDFNQNLQSIFETRLLTSQEYSRVYDWLELLKLPQEVVLMLVRFYISKKGTGISINYLDKIAEQWAKDEINSLQKAEEYIETSETCYQDTVSVLKYLGVKRAPTKAELDMYRKWRVVWGFTLDAVLNACKDTTKTSSPSFAYIDKILNKLFDLDIKSSQSISEHLVNRESLNERIKDVLQHSGHKEFTVSPEHKTLYLKWTNDWSLEHEVIILASKQCVRRKMSGSFEFLDNTLKQWTEYGLKNTKDVSEFLNERKILDDKFLSILNFFGENRLVLTSDRTIYKKWTFEWGFKHDIVLLAAEYSLMAENKIAFMNKILLAWKKVKITSVEEARAEHERHVSTPHSEASTKLSKKVDFNKFEQHNYDRQELDFLFEDIENAR